MRRFFLIANFLFISFLCTAQQNIPGKIIGKIPDWYDQQLYQIQVGAFKFDNNAENTLLLLQRNGLNPSSEKYLDLTRVMVKGIPAHQIMNFLAIIKQAGFNEVIIREDTSGTTISEKWIIISPDSEYSSFEFNHDRNYVVVENSFYENAYFGEYAIPQRDIINLDNLGTVKIRENNDTGVSFTFSPINEPGREMNFAAVKAETIPESPELDLLCRTWKVVNCTDEENIGKLLFVSNAGTYFFTDPDGVSNSLSLWRWYDDNMEEMEYSHDNWEYYGRARIISLTQNYLEVFDPGYYKIFPGYSVADVNNYWEFVPLNN